MTRQEYLVLRLAIKKGWLDPAHLGPLLQVSGEIKPVVSQLVATGLLSQDQVRQSARLVKPLLDKPESGTSRRAKDELLRLRLIEGQLCPMGAISAATAAQQSKAHKDHSLGEMLRIQGTLDAPRLEPLVAQAEDAYYKSLLRREVSGTGSGSKSGSRSGGEPGTNNPDEPSRDAAATTATSSVPVLSDFEIQEQIGQGGMGTIYRARQRSLDRIVALKVLDPKRSNATKIGRFQREARAMSELRHPNIVSILQVGEEQGTHYFAMELVTGPTLQEVLDEGRLTIAERMDLVLQVAHGLAYAHAKGVVHRDVKPANVILDDEGTPKVADFGLARHVEEDVQLTRDGAILGTPYYMSPEQIRGQRGEIGPHTDQFALGIVLYEAVTGELPFHGTSTVDIYQRIMNEDPIPIERQLAHPPPGLALVCMKALAKDPAQRYPSIDAFAKDLRAVIAARPISLRPPSSLARAFALARRHPLVTLPLAVALGATVLVYLLLPGPPAPRPPPPPPVADPPPPPPVVPPVDPKVAERATELARLDARADHALAIGRKDQALELAQAMLALAVDDARGHLVLARVHDAQGAWEEVVTHATAAAERDPKAALAYELGGKALRKRGDPVRAIAFYTAGLGHVVDHVGLMLERARAYVEAERVEESLPDLTRILELDPAHLDARWLRGQLNEQLGLHSRAAADYGAYLLKDPRAGIVWMRRAQCHEHEGKLLEAVFDYKNALTAGLDQPHADRARERYTALEQQLGGGSR